MTPAAPHYLAPDALSHRFNRLVGWLTSRGLPLAGSRNLTVTGRRSGRPQTVPVNPLSFQGREYLVAARGHTQWVRNARVHADATLTTGRRDRAVRLVEVPEEQRPEIIAAYLKRWGWEVGRFLPEGLSAKADAAAIRPHAASIPVFQVLDPGATALGWAPWDSNPQPTDYGYAQFVALRAAA